MIELDLRIDRAALVKSAQNWLGTPYQHQASLRQCGCDCLGLIRGIWREQIGGEPQDVPSYSRDAGETSCAEDLLQVINHWFEPIDELRLGCLLLFRWHPTLPAKHLGILTETGDQSINKLPSFIHSQQNLGVSQARLTQSWNNRLFKLFDFPGVDI